MIARSTHQSDSQKVIDGKNGGGRFSLFEQTIAALAAADRIERAF
jgi:hypothetical protein